jgi:hypothetical protein
MARTYLNRQNAGMKGINALLAVLCPVTLAAAPVNAVASTLTTSLTGANNDMVFTAKRKGTYGDGITVAYVNPATPSAALSVAVVDKAITVNLATGAGTVQVETATVVAAGGATSDGNLPVTVTSALFSPAVTVQVALDDAVQTTADLIATAIRAALAADATLNTYFVFSGTGADVVMTRRAAYARANDATENIAWTTTLGVTAVTNSTNTTAGVVAAITSTAAQIKTAIDASTAAAALVTVANSGGDTGAGAVTALTATALASGVNGTDAEPWQQGVYSGYLYINTRDDVPVTGSNDAWYKFQLTLVS